MSINNQKVKICIDIRVLESENRGMSRYLGENIYWLTKITFKKLINLR